jgi:hypothetical protein
MNRSLLASVLLALTSACAAYDGAQPETNNAPPKAPPETKPDPKAEPEPQPEPEPEPEPVPAAKVAISSVTMVQDCPDPTARPSLAPGGTASTPKPAAPARRAEMAAGASSLRGGPGFKQPCTQSTMQLAFSEHTGADAKVVIKAVRLVRPDTGAVLATLNARGPTAWNESGSYTDWDERLTTAAELKASYKLAVPDWNAVESGLGGVSSMGHMFALDVDVDIAGQVQTVRSPEFARERPHVVVT